MVKEGEFQTIKTIREKPKDRLDKITDIYNTKKIKNKQEDINLKNELYYVDKIQYRKTEYKHIDICIHQQYDSFGYQELYDDTHQTREYSTYCLREDSVLLTLHKNDLALVMRRNPIAFE